MITDTGRVLHLGWLSLSVATSGCLSIFTHACIHTDATLHSSYKGGNGNPLQYSCLENPMDRGVWQATVHGVAELDVTE